jgi:hypothetical protein
VGLTGVCGTAERRLNGEAEMTGAWKEEAAALETFGGG